MTAFSDQLLADAGSVFLTDFAESVTWIPKIGPQKTIQGLVTRNPPTKDGASPRQLANPNEVAISKADVPTRPIEGGDKIKLSEIIQPFTVVGVSHGTDPGMWYLSIE